MNRHERRRAAAQTRALEVPASPKARVMKFLDAFHNAPNDADIDIRIGRSATGDPAVLVSISSGGDYAMMVSEASTLADIMEESMRAHPNDPEGATLPNIIMALRAGCDEAERERH